MEDMAEEEGLGEDEGDLEGDEGAGFEVGLEGEEDMVEDGEADGVNLWEDGLMILMAYKAWRWRHGNKDCVSVGARRSPPVC